MENRKETTTAGRLKEIMDERGLRQVDVLAAAKPYCELYDIKLGKSDLSQYCSGKVEPNQQKLFVLAETLGVSESWLMGYDTTKEKHLPVPSFPNVRPVAVRRFPLYDGIAAGQPIAMPDGVDCYVDGAEELRADFALRVHGDSMSPLIPDGSIVFVRSQPEVENGRIAAVAIDDEATLKRIYRTEDALTLVAENPRYPPIVVTKATGSEVRILGLAVAFEVFIA